MMLPGFQNCKLKNKKVIIRMDLNVPMRGGKILNDMRMRAIIPTLQHLMGEQAISIILTHIGRPKGQVDPALSTRILVEPLSKMLKQNVIFIDDCLGGNAQTIIESQLPGSVILLENCRFYPGEESNDPDFARRLSQLGEFFANDGFGVSHRAHASIVGITRFLPSYAGFLMQSEIKALNDGWVSAQPPLMLMVGGSKISTKLSLLGNFVKKAQTIVVGGGIANTLLVAQSQLVGQSQNQFKGQLIGASLVEYDFVPQACHIIEQAKLHNCQLIIPQDVVVSHGLEQSNHTRSVDEICPDDKIFDIGPQTIDLIKNLLNNHKTVIWNGPLGVFESPPFDHSTNVLATHIANLTQSGQLFSLAGGGETIAALEQCNVMRKFSYCSTGGGAFLEFLEGKTLPGLAALDSHDPKISDQ